MDILSAATMLFLIMDPLGNLPIILSILKHIDPERRRKILIRELCFALLILLLFLFAGKSILSFLHVEPETLSISGGIILFMFGETLNTITFERVSEWVTRFSLGSALVAIMLYITFRYNNFATSKGTQKPTVQCCLLRNLVGKFEYQSKTFGLQSSTTAYPSNAPSPSVPFLQVSFQALHHRPI